MRYTLLILALFFAGCSEKVPQPFEKIKELVVLTRPSTTSYSLDEEGRATGFEYDLIQAFASSLGKPCRILVARSDFEILQRLENGEAHFAAAWQIPAERPGIRSSLPFTRSQDFLIKHEASLPISETHQMNGRQIHVLAGSLQEAALNELRSQVPEMEPVAVTGVGELDLMEAVSTRRFEVALVTSAAYDFGSNLFPELENALEIGPSRPVVWLFPPGADPLFIDKTNEFIEQEIANGEMNRLKDRYFGHVDRLTPIDRVRLIERIRTVLPELRPLFHSAQVQTGIDWRILAALAYQESQWNPLATSPTGVRGLMMLTEDTADLLKVSNRLDPAQSIRAGARYLGMLRENLPESVVEPDRMWLALAAYNLGMGHLNAARSIAKRKNADPDSWYEMKRILPLLAKPEYYTRLKSGRGRGGEAVIMTENIRVYLDILNRYERPYRPMWALDAQFAEKPALPVKLPEITLAH